MSTLYEQAQARVKRIEDSLNHQPIYRLPGQVYHYVFGWTKGGKRVCLGPFVDVQEADNRLAELDDGEVFPLKTRDLNKAVREIKEVLISRGEGADEALRKVLRNKGYERERGRGK